jgi:hypothetical protein
MSKLYPNRLSEQELRREEAGKQRNVGFCPAAFGRMKNGLKPMALGRLKPTLLSKKRKTPAIS